MALPSSPCQVKNGGTGDFCRGVLWRAGGLQFRGVFGKLVPWVESRGGAGEVRVKALQPPSAWAGASV